jgi:redox-sensitive bicupin YhaK (pirin superfamily)
MNTRENVRTVHGIFSLCSTHFDGHGFHVRNLFPSNPLGERIAPVLQLDHAGPTLHAPTDVPRGVGEHHLRGFETVTVVHQGELEHRDSTGGPGTLAAGDVQWLSAASGVVHEEQHEFDFARSVGTLQMVQPWVTSRARHKMSAPPTKRSRARRYPRWSSSAAPDGCA